MKTYTVRYVELVTYKFDVQAVDEEGAIDAGYEFFGELPEAKEHEYKWDVAEAFVDQVEEAGVDNA
ncbi:hypothetical protein [Streptomyces sp. NPDC059928]|uniref:hypothetical protein n=1 Tax=unclassified Streptomyces TaxID=2593676 RepID=UPI0036560693